MSTWRRALMVAIALSSSMPLGVGVLAVFDRARLLAMLHVAPSGDATTLVIFFGMAALFVAATGVLTVAWLYAERREGLTLAYLTGGMLLACALLMIVLLPIPGPAFVDLAKGLVILSLCAAVSATRKMAR